MKDSSAMKSIAVLTMIFLPATAVAAIFDTPFFEWSDDPSRKTPKAHNLSSFWAISLPLTFDLMLLWFLLVRPEKERASLLKTRYKNWRQEGTLAKWRAYVSRNGDYDSTEEAKKKDTKHMEYITDGKESKKPQKPLAIENEAARKRERRDQEFTPNLINARSPTLRDLDFRRTDTLRFIMDRPWEERDVEMGDFRERRNGEDGRSGRRSRSRSPSRERRRGAGDDAMPEGAERTDTGKQSLGGRSRNAYFEDE